VKTLTKTRLSAACSEPSKIPALRTMLLHSQLLLNSDRAAQNKWLASGISPGREAEDDLECHRSCILVEKALFQENKMTPSQKTCPACKLPAPIYAAACENCGHVFRTQFLPPMDKTQVLPPLPESHFEPPLTRRKRKTMSAAVLAGIGVFVIAALLTAFSLARHHARQISSPTLNSITGEGGSDTKNTPGHFVSVAEAEALTPKNSQQRVLETLGAPLQNVNDIWSYPADGGSAVVGIKFAGGENAKYIQGIVILDADGNLIWEKTPHLWKTMPPIKPSGRKHGLPLRTLTRYLNYITR
jgi:hypothetical protein